MNSPSQKRIAAVTVNRSDFGRMLPVYRRLQDRTNVLLSLIATGSHFSAKFGNSIDEVRESEIPVYEVPVTEDLPLLVSSQITTQVGMLMRRLEPDVLLLLGDRYEMLSCAQAAMHTDTPIVHVGGGYVTEGAIDDRVRHAITKLSHLHLVANDKCAGRIRQMGEDPNAIHNVGAPDLDMIRETDMMSIEELLVELTLDPAKPFILVTLHPETHSQGSHENDVRAFFAALSRRPEQIIITAPAAEEGADFILEQAYMLAEQRSDIGFRRNLGRKRYVTAMQYATAVVGNSSSGIIESTYFPTPAVNVGDRQKGRTQGPNVLNSDWTEASITKALDDACDPAFARLIKEMKSPYGDGHAADRIADILIHLDIPIPRAKAFFEQ